MSEQFLGCTVSIKCTEDLGSYQGQIVALNDQIVTLAKPFCNGIPHNGPTVTLRAKDIVNVDIIQVEDATAQRDVQAQSKVMVKRPIAKRVGRSVSECSVPIAQPQTVQLLPNVRKQQSEVQPYSEVQNANGKAGQARTSRKKMSERDEQAFGTPIDQSLSQDFDFEKNLALFDKEAVWQEINSKKPDVVQQSQNRGGNKGRYRHDENVLESEPTALRQIAVPSAAAKEYVTDDGLIIPSITLELQRQLIGAADRLGISWERRVELLGRAGTEIILQLLGGAHRLNPNNAHQWPTVVALCGPHRSGAAGINCARQLSSHGVKTIVYVESSEDIFLLQELSLYKLTGNKVENAVEKLPTVADLIIVALYEEKSPRTITPVAKWANNNRASILAIEPPSMGTPGIISKYSLVSGLPLSHCAENGRLYLCNLALPSRVFSDVGISYRSPFGPKFVIPLHLNSS
ncbi:enhancer of mRNA-decapping protein 3 [Phymastichus coffea]|uniref:enhancer of mRNA-decapping protein 3 n=1 Tax=Phymastichus coffea TaxID=108790 RepID=UPI00273A8D15|nr:enhancer of mRNA-decapping protein 3 [Phymastichus coffea]XP_058804146.1 enhancer of mRNA-decapping protein 3 [Phymastichus coffea]XP_058804147.1 enhancer of mRNA-decapping protein 3 [Phymastichus coffea]